MRSNARLVVCLLALAMCCCRMTVATDSSLPNILWIITDEHNFRTLGCYRELMDREQAEMWGPGAVVPTPNIDQLAKEGVICTRAYATSPVCSPCRATLVTGRYPHSVGVPTNNEVLDSSVPTIAHRLNQAGYRTSFVGKWHLAGNGKPEWAPKVNGEFQHHQYMFNRGHWKRFERNALGEPRVAARKKDGTPTYNVANADSRSFATDWLTDRAIDFMNDDTDPRPFFSVISFPDPHGPNTVRAPYDSRFVHLDFVAPRTYQTGLTTPKWLGTVNKHPVFRGKSMSQYFGMVQCIDDNVGKLIQALRKRGQLENTMIVVTSDHGDLCYEHDRLNKGNPYEGSARVPMILRLPDTIPQGQVYRLPLGTVDLMPTVLGLLGLEPPPGLEGRDLSSHLKDVSTSKNESPITFLRNAGKTAVWVAAVDRRYKLIISVNDVPWLFDAQQDPDELHNLYLRPGTEAATTRLAKALQEYGSATSDPHLSNVQINESLRKLLPENTP